jgi:NADH-quinone oxidoreductase subunit A
VTEVYWPFVLYFFLVIGVVGAATMTFVLGERHFERAKSEPYESGMPVTGSARLRFNAQFYLIAVFFVIFDLEALFIFAWAVGLREAGWTGYAEMAIFIGLLFIALIYLWKAGGLELQRSMPHRPDNKRALAPNSPRIVR